MSAVQMSTMSRRTSYVLLALCEGAVMFYCLAISTLYANPDKPFDLAAQLLCLECLVFVVVVFICMAGTGLYHARLRGTPTELLARIMLSFVLASLGEAVLFFFIPFFNMDATPIAVALLLSFFIVCLIRFAFLKLSHSSFLNRRIAVIGSGTSAAYIEQRMRRDCDRLGFDVMGYIPVNGDETVINDAKLLNVPLEQIEDYVFSQHIEELVIAADQRRGSLPMDALYRCRINGTRVTDISTFIERESAKVPLHLLNPSWLIYSEGYQASHYLVRAAKRLFDIVVSLLLLALIWPLMLVIGLLIKLEGGTSAPVIYTQQRVGRGGKPFTIYKFRSMQVNAERNGAVWAGKDDNRITAVGAFIRKYRIDELPQILNILKGDMSFVGPRPERPCFVEKLTETIPYYGDRHQVKPGLTGWAQVCYAYGADEKDALEKLQYDLYYIRHFSILLDTIILIETVEVVLFGRGAR